MYYLSMRRDLSTSIKTKKELYIIYIHKISFRSQKQENSLKVQFRGIPVSK
jgi:hypothetical protein